MYVAVKGKNENARVYLMESFRKNGKPRNKIIKSYGCLKDLTKDDPDFLENLRALYASKREEHSQTKKNFEAANAASAFDLEKIMPSLFSGDKPPTLNYSNLILQSLWRELFLDARIGTLQNYYHPKLPFNMNKILSTLCFLKIIDPSSILHAYKRKGNLLGDPLANISIDQMYSALDLFSKHKKSILNSINTVLDKKFNRNYSMVYYDVTNAYIETSLTDEECKRYREYNKGELNDILKSSVQDNLVTQEVVDVFLAKESFDFNLLPKEVAQKVRCFIFLRMRGLSKEHRYDLPLISISLVIDDNAIPIDFQIYSGCSSEYRTMVNSIEEMKKKYNIENTIVVADRGINSTENMKMLLDHNYGFLVAQKISNLKDETRKEMLNKQGYDEHVILKDSKKPQTEDNIEDIIRTKAIDYEKTDIKGNKVSCKLIFSFSKKRQQRDLRLIEENVEKAKKAIENKEEISLSKQSWVSYIQKPKEAKIKASELNTDIIKKKKEIAGYAGIIYHPAPGQEKTKVPSAKEICSAYHHLVQIEDCFRIMKTNLGLRPMYVRLEDHIEGHVTCCVLALILIRLLQIKLKDAGYTLSIDEIVEALNDANLVLIPNSSKDDWFISTSNYSNFYEIKLFKEQKEGKSTNSINLNNIMTSLGLTPLPNMCNKAIISRNCRVKFKRENLVDPNIRNLVCKASENSSASGS